MADKLLVKNLKKGLEDAYRQIVEKYGNRLLRTCYVILKDREEAEDVVKEIFIKVFQKNIYLATAGIYNFKFFMTGE